MERGLEESRKIAGIGRGRLRVGTLYSLTLETVPRLIMGMKLRRPDLEMDLTMGSNETLLHMLDEGSLDAILISISESDIDRNSLEVLPLFHDDIFLAAPASATLNTSGPADLRDYKDQKFVALAEGFATYAGFQEAFHIAGFEPEIVTRVNDIFSMLSLGAGGGRVYADAGQDEESVRKFGAATEAGAAVPDAAADCDRLCPQPRAGSEPAGAGRGRADVCQKFAG